MSINEGQTNRVGCIDRYPHGDHELQLWIEPLQGGSPEGARQFVVRQAYVPGGKHVRRSHLDSGSRDTHAETESAGRASFAREKQLVLDAVELAQSVACAR